MHWTGEVSAGDWIAGRFGRRGTVGGTVPTGFEAYARIFHPVEARLVVTEASELRVETRPYSWAELAAAKGTVWHGGMQWGAVARKQFDDVHIADGWMVQPPSDGHLDLEQLAVVAGLLAKNTTTPEAAFVGVWKGYGELHASSGSVSIIFAGADHDPGAGRRRRRASGG